MHKKERMIRTIEFRKPDRVPIVGPAFGDAFSLFPAPAKHWSPPAGFLPHVHPAIEFAHSWRWRPITPAPKGWKKQPREEVDEWGCFWDRHPSDITMGHPGRPAFETWERLESWAPPDYSDPSRFKWLGRIGRLFKNRYILACIEEGLGLFGRASMLRGFTPFLKDLRQHPNQVHQLLRRINDTYLAGLEQWLQYKPDAVFVLDDLGTQHAPFVGPTLFKSIFERYYREQIQFAHDHHLHFVLHSCGAINELIPLFQEWGVDVLEFDSPHLVGFDTIERYKEKISFWGCVDIQSVYPTATPAQVEEEVKTMIRRMGTPNGGYVAWYYREAHQVLRVPWRNIIAFKRAVKKWGQYPLNWICNLD